MSTTTDRSTADAMSNEQYREALAILGLTQGEGGQLLGVDVRTSRKWANGEREVPPTAARFLRYVIATGASAVEVMRALEERQRA